MVYVLISQYCDLYYYGKLNISANKPVTDNRVYDKVEAVRQHSAVVLL